ncbi:MAG: tetratricopeptide repeat protein [Dissulfurispiraceae bacterium]
MKKKNKKTNKTSNTEKRPMPISQESFSPRSSPNNTLVHIACIVFIILIIYSNTLNAPFQWDEDLFLVRNPIVRDLHYFVNPSDARGFEYYNFLVLRYIGFLTFALNYKMHGFSVTGYHIVNIAIHVANSILVYLLVLLTFRTPFFAKSSMKQNSLYIAFFSSMLFAVHPLQTMAVTYVFQRVASLAAFFYLLSLTAYISSRLSVGKQQRLFYYSISFISAVLAMKTKENAFTLPLVITLYEFLFFRAALKSRMIPLALMLLTMSIIPQTLIYLKGTAGAGIDPLPGYVSVVFSRPEYVLTEFRVIVTYLRLLFMPVNQNIDYDYPVFKSAFDPQVLLSFLLLFTLFGLGIYLVLRTEKKTWIKWKGLNTQPAVHGIQSLSLSAESSALSTEFRLISFGILWFFITLSVESSLIPLTRLIDEYRVYLPSVGISIAVVTGAFLIKTRVHSLKAGKGILVMLVLVAGVLAIATYRRNELWGDKIRLWEDTAKKSPGDVAVHNNLGGAYEDSNIPDKALEQFLIAVNLRPDIAEIHFNLGLAYYKTGQMEKARRELIAGLKIKPDDQRAQQLLIKVSL